MSMAVLHSTPLMREVSARSFPISEISAVFNITSDLIRSLETRSFLATEDGPVSAHRPEEYRP